MCCSTLVVLLSLQCVGSALLWPVGGQLLSIMHDWGQDENGEQSEDCNHNNKGQYRRASSVRRPFANAHALNGFDHWIDDHCKQRGDVNDQQHAAKLIN